MAMTTTTAITLAISVAMAAAAAAQAASAAKNAQRQARMQQEAAMRNNELQQAELSRQQIETVKQGREEKSDRIKAADAELSSLRAAEGEAGLTSTAFLGMANDIAAREGIDVSRLDHNTDQRLEALQSQKVATAQGYTDTALRAGSEAAATTNRATFKAIGSGLQIASNTHDRIDAQERAKNRT